MNPIQSKSIRQTAAIKFVFDDMKVAEIFEALDGANESLGTAIEGLATAKQNYDIAKGYLDDQRNYLTLTITEKVLAEDPKTSQAAIDRAIKTSMLTDELYVQREQKVLEEKNDLDDAQGNHDVEKSNQRTLLAQAQLVGATLQYLSASKTARATAMAHLADL